MEHLFEKLQRNAKGDIYPYHMPGHKRRSWGKLPEGLFQIDITEIDSFDNLHQPEGILLELQRKASRLYGAEESFYLVNGSTCGVLSAISCALPPGGHVLMARNCHKSAYHAAYLRGLSITYLYPPYLDEYDVFDAVLPGQVREALEQEPDIGAVIVVSPTYEGRIADIGAIAKVVHERGIPLIVDEAHGAHLGLAREWPRNSCQLGADLVIHSVHKTLPSLTQTALLHVNGSLIDRGRLKRFLHIYQSSSPSYVLMASIDNALQYVESDGQEAFGRFRTLYGNMMEKLSGCGNLRFLSGNQVVGDASHPSLRGRECQDVGKLLISVKGTPLTGKGLYDVLSGKYGLQLEMASESFALAMFTVNDGEEAYRRMTDALLEIDRTLTVCCEDVNRGLESDETPNCEIVNCEIQNRKAENSEMESPKAPKREIENCEATTPGIQDSGVQNVEAGNHEFFSSNPQSCIPLSKAWDMHSDSVTLEESVGRLAGEFINLYPPGIPLLAPGERMTGALSRHIRRCMEQGLTVQGIDIRDGKAFVKVICEFPL